VPTVELQTAPTMQGGVHGLTTTALGMKVGWTGTKGLGLHLSRLGGIRMNEKETKMSKAAEYDRNIGKAGRLPILRCRRNDKKTQMYEPEELPGESDYAILGELNTYGGE
jgi:hypothetical protein